MQVRKGTPVGCLKSSHYHQTGNISSLSLVRTIPTITFHLPPTPMSVPEKSASQLPEALGNHTFIPITISHKHWLTFEIWRTLWRFGTTYFLKTHTGTLSRLDFPTYLNTSKIPISFSVIDEDGFSTVPGLKRATFSKYLIVAWFGPPDQGCLFNCINCGGSHQGEPVAFSLGTNFNKPDED